MMFEYYIRWLFIEKAFRFRQICPRSRYKVWIVMNHLKSVVNVLSPLDITYTKWDHQAVDIVRAISMAKASPCLLFFLFWVHSWKTFFRCIFFMRHVLRFVSHFSFVRWLVMKISSCNLIRSPSNTFSNACAQRKNCIKMHRSDKLRNM